MISDNGLSSDTPSHEDVLQSWLDSHSSDLHTAFPGKIQSYDPNTRTATVLPLIKVPLQTEDGDIVSESLPALPHIPILFPRVGPWSWTAPVASGDLVLVVACESSIGHLRATGEASEPGYLRRHGLGSCVALLGFFCANPAPAPSDQTALVIGKDGGVKLALADDGIVHISAYPADEYAAIAGIVNSALSTLRTAMNTHTHPVSGAAAGVTVNGQTAPFPDCKAPRVKIPST